jgi:myo-inositol-1(or 4)-monophosphatase
MDLVDAAVEAAERAGSFLRAAPRPELRDWTEKGRNDFVTAVDRGAEAIIAEVLQRRVPDSTIVGEELSPHASLHGDIVWLVDPLDGTTNYLHGYPQYAVSIGALVNGELAVGVVHDVARDVTLRGANGHGAWMGEQRLATSLLCEPRHALVGTGFPFKHLDTLQRYLHQFATVIGVTSGIRRAGAAALDLADVAAGRLDLFWELRLAPWDVAAGVVPIREAGGIVTTLDGSADVLGGGSIVAGNAALHHWLLGTLNKA